MTSRDQLPSGVHDDEAYVRAVHDRGLAFDLGTMSRRRMLALGGLGAATAVLAGTGAAQAACVEEIPSETAGPYPGDGSNGPDVRTQSGIVRRDIRSSFGSSSGTAEGVPLTFSITVQDQDCTPIEGAAVYAWHCDRDGSYSLYSTGVTDQNYLRGIQETDASGTATFTSIFPACYSGRWPHIHFEVYASLAQATSGSGPIRKTSQMALPADVVKTVYAQADGYSRSVDNLAGVSLGGDNVFGDDDGASQLATVTGSVARGYTATLTAVVDLAGEETGGGAPPGPGRPGGPGGPGGPTSSTSSSTTSSSTTSTPTSSTSTSGPVVQADGPVADADAPVAVGTGAAALGVLGAAAAWWRQRQQPQAPAQHPRGTPSAPR